MYPFIFKALLAGIVCLWLFFCMFLYTSSRNAAWLAGSTVPTCLFFLGVTAAASVLVPGTIYLLPLGAGVLILALVHLLRAQRENSYLSPSAACDRAFHAPPSQPSHSELSI